ncbi:MAG: Rrf2 family transcriptional regulator [Ardenticatenaceae bacterium]|nr:Rrf2 family transcriptional regulator [Anaerolineales bacterium]MCB8923606.1 Rrf2 family transcriptional regulator [Ardenticatenaceae bacterium]
MSMFQISRRADYAVRIMIELGLHGEEATVPVRQIARRTGVPKAFLHKITADLVKADLVETFAGPGGGVALGRPLNKINMLQIIEAADGPICLNICLVSPHECPLDQICSAHTTWGRLQTILTQELEAATLAKLVDEARQYRKMPNTNPDVPYLSLVGQPRNGSQSF